MNEGRLTYAELKLSQNSKKEKKQPNQKKGDYSWRRSVVILGTICLCLLMSNAVLGYLYFKVCSNFKGPCEKDVNEGAVSSMKVLNSSALSPTTGKGCYTCQERWFCCGETCYYFSEEQKTWDESEASCRLMGSHLAKIDSREEKNFIQSRLNYSYWVGLRQKGDHFLWVHQKDAELSSDLEFHWKTHLTDAVCGYIRPKDLHNAQCSRYFYYICKKKFTCRETLED